MAEPLPLLNIYDLETEDGTVSILCFLDPVLAGAKGIDARSVVGDYVTDPGGDFDAEAFRVNPGFVESLTGFMNEETAASEAIAGQARAIRSDWLYVVDPRDRTAPDDEPPPSNVLGAFAVDDAGQVVPGSFQYNANHRMFDRQYGTSGLLFDRAFYDWLHDLDALRSTSSVAAEDSLPRGMSRDHAKERAPRRASPCSRRPGSCSRRSGRRGRAPRPRSAGPVGRDSRACSGRPRRGRRRPT